MNKDKYQKGTEFVKALMSIIMMPLYCVFFGLAVTLVLWLSQLHYVASPFEFGALLGIVTSAFVLVFLFGMALEAVGNIFRLLGIKELFDAIGEYALYSALIGIFWRVFLDVVFNYDIGWWTPTWLTYVLLILGLYTATWIKTLFQLFEYIAKKAKRV